MNPLDELEVALAGIRILIPGYARTRMGRREWVDSYYRTLRIGDPGQPDDDLSNDERRALGTNSPEVSMVERFRRNSEALRDMRPLERLEAKLDSSGWPGDPGPRPPAPEEPIVHPDPSFERDWSENAEMRDWDSEGGTPATDDEATDLRRFLPPEQQGDRWGATPETRTPPLSEQVRAEPEPVEAPRAKTALERLRQLEEKLHPGSTANYRGDPSPDPSWNVVWEESEWADEGSSAYLKGYEADVFPRTYQVTVDEEVSGYDWTVKATEAVSEYPELQESGFEITETKAQAAAAAALRRAAEHAPDRNPNSGELNSWVVVSLLDEFEIPDTEKNRADMRELLRTRSVEEARQMLLSIHGPAGARTRVIYGGGPNTLRSP